MPAPLIMGAAAVAARLAAKKAASNVVKKAAAKKAASAAKSSRQAGDYAISKNSAKRVIPNMSSLDKKGKTLQISSNVGIKNGVSPSHKVYIQGGSSQVMNQNARLTASLSKAEAKGNARGLKAANKPTNKTGTKANRTERKIINKNFNAPAKSNYVQQLRREGTSPRKTTRGK